MKILKILLFSLYLTLNICADIDNDGKTDIQLQKLESFLEGCIIERKLEETNQCDQNCEEFFQTFDTKDNKQCEEFYDKIDNDDTYNKENLNLQQAREYQQSCISNNYYSFKEKVKEEVFYCVYHDIGQYLYVNGHIEPTLEMDFISLYYYEECEDMCFFDFQCQSECINNIDNSFNLEGQSCIESEFVSQELQSQSKIQPNFYSKETAYWESQCQIENLQNVGVPNSKEYQALKCASQCLSNNNDFVPETKEEIQDGEEYQEIVFKYQEAEDKTNHHISWDDYNECSQVCYQVYQCDQTCQDNINENIDFEHKACKDYEMYDTLELYLGGVHQQYIGTNSAFFLQKCFFQNMKYFHKDTNQYDALLCKAYCLGYNIEPGFPGTFAALEEVEFCYQETCSIPNVIETYASQYNQCQKYQDMVAWQQEDQFVQQGYLSYQSLEQLQKCLEQLEQQLEDIYQPSLSCVKTCLNDNVMNEDHVTNFDKNREQTFTDEEKKDEYQNAVNENQVQSYVQCTEKDLCYETLDTCIASCQETTNCLDLSCVGVDNRDDLINKYNYELLQFIAEECSDFNDNYYNILIENNQLYDDSAISIEFLQSFQKCLINAKGKYTEGLNLLQCTIDSCVQPGIQKIFPKEASSNILNTNLILLLILLLNLLQII